MTPCRYEIRLCQAWQFQFEVYAVWPDGHTIYVGGFRSRDEAERLIRREERRWETEGDGDVTIHPEVPINGQGSQTRSQSPK